MTHQSSDATWTTPLAPYWADTRSATLIFDTHTAPPPPGLRAATTTGRHLLFEAAPYTIDVYFEPGGAERIMMAGQIIEAGRSTPWMNEARVTVASAGVQICSANVSRLGEFQCQFDRHEEVSLVVATRSGHPILIPLML